MEIETERWRLKLPERLIHIDAQDAQDFFRRRLACVPGHP